MLAIFATQNQFCIAILVCNLYSNTPLQGTRVFNVYYIFTNAREGMHRTGCSFTSQIAMIQNISAPIYVYKCIYYHHIM